MFFLSLNYLKPLTEIDALLPAHREYLDRHYADGTFLLSGRKVPRTGGVILAQGDDPAAIRALTDTDPFVTAGAAEYEITQFTATAVSPGDQPVPAVSAA